MFAFANVYFSYVKPNLLNLKAIYYQKHNAYNTHRVWTLLTFV